MHDTFNIRYETFSKILTILTKIFNAQKNGQNFITYPKLSILLKLVIKKAVKHRLKKS